MKKRKMNNIEKKLGIQFNNKELLNRALTHRSFLNENRGIGLKNNERLEFLGDAVLELIISSKLFNIYPDRAEGELTGIRSALVRTESLAEESRRLDVGKYLLMSKGEEDSGGRDKDYLLANAYEAILGAIYLDRGLEECTNFVERTVLKQLDFIVKNELFIDPKTKIQELIQAKYKITPTYEVVEEKGPDHEKYFTVALKIGDKFSCKGYGASKQKAEEDAAQKAIKNIEKGRLFLNKSI
ncbi:MAG: ribonuclease III [Candidatus Dojkabacteria bacterium]